MNTHRNNVQISGQILREDVLERNVQVMVGIDNLSTAVPVLISQKVWNKFKDNFSEEPKSITVSGELNDYWVNRDFDFAIKANRKNSVICFHNMLQEYLDESGIKFEGIVKLKAKIGFDSDSSLLVKRMLFETVSKYPVTFAATALRKFAPYFDDLEPGTELVIKADYVPLTGKDDCCHKYYWRIRSIPTLSLSTTPDDDSFTAKSYFPTVEPA